MSIAGYLGDQLSGSKDQHGPLGNYLRGKLSGALGSNKADDTADPDAYKKGGVVKKTGIAKVHKGERVLTKKQAKRFGKKR